MSKPRLKRSTSGNFVWDQSAFLGEGATCKVYMGRDQRNGKKCAVKSFNPDCELGDREREILRELDHENVVCCLSVDDKERQTDSACVVMELCSGGDLSDVLEKPQNKFGLDEDEFLLLLKHLVGGMKYIKEKNIVHRDIKPGNIMKATGPDGRSVYKLTDFGGARQLDSLGQRFSTLVGTEEYLHPRMYEYYLHPHHSTADFGTKVDMWSLGATLYHCATGDLPFAPDQGVRVDKAAMYKLLTEKPSGVISGKEQGGKMKWHRSLPSTSKLSQHLKQLITPVLAGLLETDESKAWAHDTFFKETAALLGKKIFHVFNVRGWKLEHVFLSDSETIDDLKAHLHYLTELDLSTHRLITEGGYLDAQVPRHASVDVLPGTTPMTPYIMWPEPGCVKVVARKIPDYVNYPHPLTSKDMVTDYYESRACNIYLHDAERLAEQQIMSMMHVDKGVRIMSGMYRLRLTSKIELVTANIASVRSKLESQRRTLDEQHKLFQAIAKSRRSGTSPIQAEIDREIAKVEKTIKGSIETTIDKLQKLCRQYDTGNRQVSTQWDNRWLCDTISKHQWVEKIKLLIPEVDEIRQEFYRVAKERKKPDNIVIEGQRASLMASCKQVEESLKQCMDVGVATMQKNLIMSLRDFTNCEDALQEMDEGIKTLESKTDEVVESYKSLQNRLMRETEALSSRPVTSPAQMPAHHDDSDKEEQLKNLMQKMKQIMQHVNTLGNGINSNQQQLDRLAGLTESSHT